MMSTTSPSVLFCMNVISRSEEHTSELQSQSNLVCRLLLEKKKKSDDQSHWAVGAQCAWLVAACGSNPGRLGIAVVPLLHTLVYCLAEFADSHWSPTGPSSF